MIYYTHYIFYHYFLWCHYLYMYVCIPSSELFFTTFYIFRDYIIITLPLYSILIIRIILSQTKTLIITKI